MDQVDDLLSVDDLLHKLVELKASDLHIKAGCAPMLRVDGELVAAVPRIMKPAEVRELCESMLTDEQKAKFIADRELDLAYSIPGLSRFRVNIYLQRGSWAAALRVIPQRPPTLKELNMPPIIADLALRPRGLVLVTGPTGSGKSTTLAAMINHINEHRHCHIVTCEDPIEFIHNDKNCVVSQREVGSDTHSFAMALKHVLRQDPDVILIGEMRDFETTAIAITAAETGHIVFATLHTNSAASTVDRVIDVFPIHQQQQIRMQLSVCLEGVVCQNLIPKASGQGRVMAMEIMPMVPALRNLIREGKTHQIPTTIQTNRGAGMQAFDMCLARLVYNEQITFEDAIAKAQNAEDLQRLIRSLESGNN